MGQSTQQGKSVDALKLLNNAIVTSRLYPPEAPQVAIAVERGYKGLKLFLREQGPLSFSFKDDLPCLCGQSLDQETLALFPNLVVFRQLRMLGLSQLLLTAEMDRFAFSQILYVFNAPIEKSKKSGGGTAFITELGLAGYFPEKGEGVDGPDPVDIPDPADSKPRKLVKVRPELLACLCGKDKRPTVEAELKMCLANTDSAIDLLAAGIGHVLQDILKNGLIVASPLLPVMLRGAETAIGEKSLHEVGLGLARILSENLREPALCVLLCQEFPQGFGEKFYDDLIAFISLEKVRDIFVLFREQLAKARLVSGDTSPRVEFLGGAMHRLMFSAKGKQFLSTEKARALIQEGESIRKKRRLEAGIQGLLQGNQAPLKSEELLEYLPDAITEKFANQAEQEAQILLQRIVAHLLQESEKTTEAFLVSTLVIGDKLIAGGHIGLTDMFLDPLLAVVRRGTFAASVLEKSVVFLHQLMQESWHRGDNKRGDKILTLLHMIRTGQICRGGPLAGIVGRVQDRGFQRAKLPALLAECLASPLDEDAANRLAFQGPIAVRFLVESLINTDDADDRMKIIDLLTSNSSFLAPIIHERLPEHMPWYGKRNLLKLLGESGSEEDAEKVLPYLKHEDLRVQREAFLCLYKISGKNRKKLLLSALEDSSELIKKQIVEALDGFCDNEVAAVLMQMLTESDTFSEKNRSQIMLQLLETLGSSGSQAALKGVESFLGTRGQRSTKKIPDHIWNAAEKAKKYLVNDIQATKKQYQQAGQLRKNALKQVARLSKAHADLRVITSLPQEQMIRSLVSQGDKAAALNVLVQLIEKTAKARNFIQAESLREWLIEIDPSAFTDIIHVAEFIDREKAAAIDKSHLEIWNQLYESLTSEEFAAVYHGQKHKRYQDGEVVVSQGAMQTALFFINSGKVKLYYEETGKEVLVKTMGRGEIFGAGAFFDASVWTISVAGVGPSEISVLKLDKLREWKVEFPRLERKLREFCSKFENIEDFLRKNEKDRRTQERFKITGRVSTTLVSSRGQGIGVNNMAELANISIGGLAYRVKISKKENARLLLGRKVRIKLPAGVKPGQFDMVTGDILAVRSIQSVENEYSIHVRFDAILGKSKLEEMLAAAGREAQVH